MELSPGGGGVTGTYGPITGLASTLKVNAASLAAIGGQALAPCGNPGPDAAVASLGSHLQGAVANLAKCGAATNSDPLAGMQMPPGDPGSLDGTAGNLGSWAQTLSGGAGSHRSASSSVIATRRRWDRPRRRPTGPTDL